MRGGIEDSGNRQDKRISSLMNNSAGLLLSRLLHLANEIDISLGFIRMSDSLSYTGVTLAMDEAFKVRQDISEFLGLLYCMEHKCKNLLLPYRVKIDNLKIRLGIY